MSEWWEPASPIESEVIGRINRFFTAQPRNNTYNIAQITDFIYLGNISDATDFSTLEDNGITAVLSLIQKELPLQNQIYEPHIKFLSFPADDIEDYQIEQHFKEAIAFLSECEQEKRKVLVHCRAGISRSATIVMAYLINLIKSKQLSIEEMEKKLATRNNLKSFSFSDLSLPPFWKHVTLGKREEESLFLLVAVYFFVFQHRCIVNPNDGFVSQLWKFVHHSDSYSIVPPSIQDNNSENRDSQ